MQTWQYEISFTSLDGIGTHFELRLDDHNRPFHLKIDSSNNYVAVNYMEAGKWDVEVPLSQNAEIRSGTILIVWVSGHKIYIDLDGTTYLFYMKQSSDDVTLHAAGKNVHFQWGRKIFSQREKINFLNLPEKRIAEIRLAGKNIILPPSIDQTMALDLVSDIERRTDRYLRFLGSRLLRRQGEAFTIIDLNGLSSHLALLASILHPDARILAMCAEQEKRTFIEDIASANGLKNIECYTRSESISAIKEIDGAILLQGPAILESFGETLSCLDRSQLGRISLYSDADEVIPSNAVPCFRNVDIHVNDKWTLSFNEIAGPSALERRLDVVVAAYNACAYVVECVKTILSDGRDDVRVIVVDDGSTDNTRSVLQKEFDGDLRVQIISKENGGCASARNFGRLESSATHIAFVDADDFVCKDFFATLFDIAVYSGCEVVQGGFDFYDESAPEKYRVSYEDDLFGSRPTEKFGKVDVMKIGFRDLAVGQPSIWRRVYRRDYLDCRSIFFRESIRAYDDYSFQMICSQGVTDAIFAPNLKYHYRQHPNQDIKSGDVRHFNMISMFQDVLSRCMTEAWKDIDVFLESMSSSIDWSIAVLEPHMKDRFMISAAQFCAKVQRCLGEKTREIMLGRISHPDFVRYLDEELERMRAFPDGNFWSLMREGLSHPEMLKMRAATRMFL